MFSMMTTEPSKIRPESSVAETHQVCRDRPLHHPDERNQHDSELLGKNNTTPALNFQQKFIHDCA